MAVIKQLMKERKNFEEICTSAFPMNIGLAVKKTTTIPTNANI